MIVLAALLICSILTFIAFCFTLNSTHFYLSGMFLGSFLTKVFIFLGVG